MKIELYVDEIYVPSHTEEGLFIELPCCPRIGEMIQVGPYDYKVDNITWKTGMDAHITPWPMLFMKFPPGGKHWETLTKHMTEEKDEAPAE